MRTLNRRGAAEGISWAGGLIIIVFIIILFLGIYALSGLGKKDIISVSLNNDGNDFYDALTSQRIGAALFTSDFLSPNKGELLKIIYKKEISNDFRQVFRKRLKTFASFISYDYFVVHVGAEMEKVDELSADEGRKCAGVNADGFFPLSNDVESYILTEVVVRRCK